MLIRRRARKSRTPAFLHSRTKTNFSCLRENWKFSVKYNTRPNRHSGESH